MCAVRAYGVLVLWLCLLKRILRDMVQWRMLPNWETHGKFDHLPLWPWAIALLHLCLSLSLSLLFFFNEIGMKNKLDVMRNLIHMISFLAFILLSKRCRISMSFVCSLTFRFLSLYLSLSVLWSSGPSVCVSMSMSLLFLSTTQPEPTHRCFSAGCLFSRLCVCNDFEMCLFIFRTQ